MRKHNEAKRSRTRCDCCSAPATVMRGSAAFCAEHSRPEKAEKRLKNFAEDLADKHTK